MAARPSAGNVRILTAPDQRQLAADLAAAGQRVGASPLAEGAGVEVGRIEAGGGQDLGVERGAKGEMAADAEADRADPTVAPRVLRPARRMTTAASLSKVESFVGACRRCPCPCRPGRSRAPCRGARARDRSPAPLRRTRDWRAGRGGAGRSARSAGRSPDRAGAPEIAGRRPGGRACNVGPHRPGRRVEIPKLAAYDHAFPLRGES